ncbi:C45 family autoproteolytic acyltransferase/hydolase [Streptacidiphilus jiangxiensis]|uniref:Isopenicillin-N N-acyltransferase like protein n=1 Tax=Streptacidiphilus jiangxiensis TaxID=235985 RepID=A0A1H7NE64_STRJI|nr:C45 family peptidase [Streptacidiphilus jiangxiensis]SEL21876.1 isopenicillin-N N-acyltransferase like protein [Streptacidiphilus jiangxiensis]
MTTPTVFRSPATEPGERGLLLGRAFPDRIHRTCDFYDTLFAAAGAAPADVGELGRTALAAIAATAPALAEEIDGIARGAQLPVERIAALNARTEILGRFGRQHPECSTVVHAPADGRPPVTTQTWDWHDDMRDGWFVWHIEHPDGRSVRTVTEYGIVGKIGVNAAGLGLHFNILAHAADASASVSVSQRGWLPVHVLARHVLDTCGSVDEAARLAMATPVAASSSLTLAGYEQGRARAATVELSPAEPALLRPGTDGYLLRTNHFVDPTLAAGEALATEDPDTRHRLDALHARTALRPAPDTSALLDTLDHHLADGAALCCHADPAEPLGKRWETLATVSIDVTSSRLHVHAGGPCTARGTEWTVV